MEESPGGRPAESRRVGRGRIVMVCGVWNIPVITAVTRVGDADVSGRSEGGVTTLSSFEDSRPFWVYM